MHAETPRFASKTTIFPKHEVFEVSVHDRITLFFLIFFKLKKTGLKLLFLIWKIINFPNIYDRYVIMRNINFNLM